MESIAWVPWYIRSFMYEGSIFQKAFEIQLLFALHLKNKIKKMIFFSPNHYKTIISSGIEHVI